MFLAVGGVLALVGAAGLLELPVGLPRTIASAGLILGLYLLFEGGIRLGVFDLPFRRDAVLAFVAGRIQRGRRRIIVSCSAQGLDELFEWRDGLIAHQLEAKLGVGIAVEIVHDGGSSRHALTTIGRWVLRWSADCQVYGHPGHQRHVFHGVLVDDRVLVLEGSRHAPGTSWRKATVFRWPGAGQEYFMRSLRRCKGVA